MKLEFKCPECGGELVSTNLWVPDIEPVDESKPPCEMKMEMKSLNRVYLCTKCGVDKNLLR